MTIRMGLGDKGDGTPVLKVMSDAAYDPRTTPNTDWGKFLWNSEVPAVPYADMVDSWTIPGASLTTDTQFAFNPAGNSTTFKGKYVFSNYRDSSWTLTPYANAPYLFDNPNAFHYLVRNAVDWVYIWECQTAENLDAWGSGFRTSRLKYPMYNFLPVQVSGVWHIYGALETFGSSIDTGTVNGSHRIWPSVATGVKSSQVANDDAKGGITKASWQARDWSFSYYQINLPINEDDYPATVGTPTPGLKILRIDEETAKLAKPGFDVDTATGDQLIFDSDQDDRNPIRIVKCGSFTIAAGATVTIDLGFGLDVNALVDYQAQQTGGDLFLPPFPTGDTSAFRVGYKISGNSLLFKNDSALSLDVRYFVMSKDTLGGSTGSAKVFEVMEDGEIVIRRPGTAGSKFDDVLFSSKQAFMPIAYQGWVDFADFVASDTTKLGTHMYQVAIDLGGYKPYVLAKLKRQKKSDSNYYVYKPFFIRNASSMSYYADSSFIAKVTDEQVTFYCSDGSRKENNPDIGDDQNGYLNTIGLRYYIFAVPPTL